MHMKYLGPLLVVKEIEKSKQFYLEVLGCEIISDFGANIALTAALLWLGAGHPVSMHWKKRTIWIPAVRNTTLLRTVKNIRWMFENWWVRREKRVLTQFNERVSQCKISRETISFFHFAAWTADSALCSSTTIAPVVAAAREISLVPLQGVASSMVILSTAASVTSVLVKNTMA